MMPVAKEPTSKRVAIYCRKSTEEGLDSDFNSLDAQRACCQQYIASQASEGWLALPETFEDGGFSGSNTERPGLQRLLKEVEAGSIDVIAVYKLDRNHDRRRTSSICCHCWKITTWPLFR
jgi:DNA invertase Pin-like site-specific DNA recombinase